MGNQCCKVPTHSINEIVYEQSSIKFSSINKQSLHSNSYGQTINIAQQQQEQPEQDLVVEPLEIQKEIYEEQELNPPSEIRDKVIEASPTASPYKRVQISIQSEKIIEEPSPKKRNTINSVGTLKISTDLFVNLKQGNIHKYYTTGAVLGQGAYGKVWKVTHKTTGLVRAMKQLKKSSLILEEQQRLFAEMNILKNLDHPHIVKLYELYQDENNYYLVTEYLSGGELFDRIKEMSFFSEKKAADFMRQILSAVVYCHEQKIVHRDLKPENILFINDSPTSNLKVIDFGTSRKYDAGNGKQMTKKLGTPYYIAPEVLKQQYNEKCDVWSCGVIMYILLCGYPPFTGKTEKEIMKRVSEGKYEFDYNQKADDWSLISKEAKILINKMLHVNPNHRISAKQALNDPWIIKFAPNQVINTKVLQNLQKFQAKSVFTQAVLAYIASQMTSQAEIDELQKTFQSLDKNSDGILSKEELIEGYTNYLKNRTLAEQEVTKILAIVDINQSNQVDFTEFIMAAMNQEKLLSAQKVKGAFKIFDQNDDGKISKEELEQVMGNVDEDLWQQILQECGGNEYIEEKDFMDILLNKL